MESVLIDHKNLLLLINALTYIVKLKPNQSEVSKTEPSQFRKF
jgi:hypothetical protein